MTVDTDQFPRTMPEDEGYSSLNAQERVTYRETDKRDPLDGPDEFYGWQPWALATNEFAAMRWLDAHDEDGHDYLDDHTAAEGHYGGDDE